MNLNPVDLVGSLFNLMVAKFFRKKRRQRKAELSRHIEAIRHKDGCVEALSRRYGACIHISKKYNIPFAEVGFDGDASDLTREAIQSLKRARDREQSDLWKHYQHSGLTNDPTSS